MTTGIYPPPPAIAPRPERRARDVAGRGAVPRGGEGGKAECRLRRRRRRRGRRQRRRRREEEGGDDGGGANDRGAEARRRAADRRRPGESLLFSSHEMNSQKIGERGATGRRGGSNDSYVERNV